MSADSITGTNGRSTCWSITVNNPTENDLKVVLPAGWSVEGQIERGENGTTHYQAMLKTPQVRFAAVKKVFPRAHIEVARNKTALAKYVHKDDTRVAEVETRKSSIPTLWDYQQTVAKHWSEEEFEKTCQDTWSSSSEHKRIDDIALEYVDTLVARDIARGQRAAEFIAINPMWRSSWKKFWREIITREKNIQKLQGAHTDSLERGVEETTETTKEVSAADDSPC